LDFAGLRTNIILTDRVNCIYIYSFSRRFYPKQLTNENNRSSTNSRTTIHKYRHSLILVQFFFFCK